MKLFRFVLRQLLRQPGFTTVAVLTLALGIGANTVVFSVAKSVLFRPLGFTAPDKLVWIQRARTRTGEIEDRLSWREIEDIRESTGSFETVASFGSQGAIWQQGDRVEEVTGLRVTPNLGDLLLLRPALGRMLLPTDAVDGAEPAVMISHELWQSRFGGSPGVIGQRVRLDQKSHAIVGVLPAGLQFPLERAPSAGTGSNMHSGVQDVWFPFNAPRGTDSTSRGARMFLSVARLNAGTTENSARAELTALGQRLATDYPETSRDSGFALTSFRDQVLGHTRNAIPLLGFAVFAVLLICCVNLANLLLARGVTRQREIAVRLALGAGRRRIVQRLMLESLILSALGGGAGLVLAEVTLQGVRVFGAANVPFIREARLDLTAVLFTAVISLVTAVFFGLLPALRLSRLAAIETLRSGTRLTEGRQVRSWQRGLLTAQIAVVLVLLASSGLLLESFRRLVGQELGYQPKSVITVDLSTWGFGTNDEVCQLYRRLQARLKMLPGVEAVGTVSSAPLTGKWIFDEKPQVVGRPLPEAERPAVSATFVAFDYFQAMGIPLLDGRLFRDVELKDHGYGQTVILNQSAAAVLFPDGSAVGGRFTVGSNPDRVLEVVGVVKDTRDVRLEEKPHPRFYWQYAFGGAQVVMRTSAPIAALLPLVRDAVKEIDTRILSQNARPMSEIVSSTVAERRFLVMMVTVYAGVALLVAVVGVFGVIAYQVAQRNNEFGIRLALGASPASIMRLVLFQVGGLVIVGVGFGILLSLGSGQFLASQLFDVSPHDPRMLGGVGLLVVIVSLIASALPARRAGRVDPMVALRDDG